MLQHERLLSKIRKCGKWVDVIVGYLSCLCHLKVLIVHNSTSDSNRQLREKQTDTVKKAYGVI